MWLSPFSKDARSILGCSLQSRKDKGKKVKKERERERESEMILILSLAN